MKNKVEIVQPENLPINMALMFWAMVCRDLRYKEFNKMARKQIKRILSGPLILKNMNDTKKL
jgi:hypothetical protein